MKEISIDEFVSSLSASELNKLYAQTQIAIKNRCLEHEITCDLVQVHISDDEKYYLFRLYLNTGGSGGSGRWVRVHYADGCEDSINYIDELIGCMEYIKARLEERKEANA